MTYLPTDIDFKILTYRRLEELSPDGDIFELCVIHNWGSETYRYVCVTQREKGKDFSDIKRQRINRKVFYDEQNSAINPKGQRGVDIVKFIMTADMEGYLDAADLCQGKEKDSISKLNGLHH